MRTVWCVWRGDDGRCRVDGITYKLICKGCDEVYVGETSKNAYTRGLEHLYSVIAPVKDPSKPKPTLRAHVDTLSRSQSTCFQDRINGCLRRRRYEAASERGGEDSQHSWADEQACHDVSGGRCFSDPEEDSSARLSPLTAVPGANNESV